MLITVCAAAFVVTLLRCAHASPRSVGTILASLWSLEGCGEVLEDQGALVLARVWVDQEWWRVLTTGFLHGSWLHLGVNCWSLWVVGEWAEIAWGSLRTVGLFAASCVCAGLASLLWCEAPTVIGASGGVMGLAGGLLVARGVGDAGLRARLEPVSAPVLGGFLVVLLVLGAFVPRIAQAGHIGGLGAGLAVGVLLSRRLRWRRLWWALLAAVMAALAVASARPAWADGYHELLGYRRLALGDVGRALNAFELALGRRPEEAELQNAVAYALAEAGTELIRAEVLVREALATEPHNADYLDTLGWILCRRGQAAAGLAALGEAERAAERVIAEIAEHQRECRTARRKSPKEE